MMAAGSIETRLLEILWRIHAGPDDWRSFQTLAVRKPNLDAGVYAYAKAGFGEYLGFLLRLRLLGQCLCRQRDLLGC